MHMQSISPFSTIRERNSCQPRVLMSWIVLVELSWRGQNTTQFEITGVLCGLSICRICVHKYLNHIHFDAPKISPLGLDTSCPKLVPTRWNRFRRLTDAVVMCGVHVGRGGHLALCGLACEVLGPAVARTAAATAQGCFGLLSQHGALMATSQTRRNWTIPSYRGGGWCSCTGIRPVKIISLPRHYPRPSQAAAPCCLHVAPEQRRLSKACHSEARTVPRLKIEQCLWRF